MLEQPAILILTVGRLSSFLIMLIDNHNYDKSANVNDYVFRRKREATEKRLKSEKFAKILNVVAWIVLDAGNKANDLLIAML